MLSIDSEFYQEEMKVFLCCNLKKKEKETVYGVLHGFTERKPFIITVQQNEYLPQSFSETV